MDLLHAPAIVDFHVAQPDQPAPAALPEAASVKLAISWRTKNVAAFPTLEGGGEGAEKHLPGLSDPIPLALLFIPRVRKLRPGASAIPYLKSLDQCVKQRQLVDSINGVHDYPVDDAKAVLVMLKESARKITVKNLSPPRLELSHNLSPPLLLIRLPQ
jgi:hypothetical protein